MSELLLYLCVGSCVSVCIETNVSDKEISADLQPCSPLLAPMKFKYNVNILLN